MKRSTAIMGMAALAALSTIALAALQQAYTYKLRPPTTTLQLHDERSAALLAAPAAGGAPAPLPPTPAAPLLPQLQVPSLPPQQLASLAEPGSRPPSLPAAGPPAPAPAPVPAPAPASVPAAATAGAAPQPFVVLLSGHLRTFHLSAATLADFFARDPRFHGRPHYVFLHTWAEIESSEASWWKKAAPPPPVAAEFQPEATLRDSAVNPWASSDRFASLVETYDKSSVPTPRGSPELLFSQHAQWETRRRVHRFASSWLADRGIVLDPATTVVIKTRPDSNYLNVPDLLEMESLLRQRPATFLGFCKGGAKFPNRIADSAWVSSMQTFNRMDEFDYMGQPSIVLKSKQEPEVNLAQILKALRIRTVLEVVGVQFCRVRWLNGADGDDTNVNVNAGGKRVGLGNCVQHSKWDRDGNNQPNGAVATLRPWLEKAASDQLWAAVPVG